MSPKKRSKKAEKVKKVRTTKRQRIQEATQNRCGYCLSNMDYIPAFPEIDHIKPRAEGGSNKEVNLCLSCPLCNRYKGDQTEGFDPDTGLSAALYNPRTQVWHEHFQWSDDGTLIIGLTPTGRATVASLQLNNKIAVAVRRNWVSVGWHPPKGFEGER